MGIGEAEVETAASDATAAKPGLSSFAPGATSNLTNTTAASLPPSPPHHADLRVSRLDSEVSLDSEEPHVHSFTPAYEPW